MDQVREDYEIRLGLVPLLGIEPRLSDLGGQCIIRYATGTGTNGGFRFFRKFELTGKGN